MSDRSNAASRGTGEETEPQADVPAEVGDEQGESNDLPPEDPADPTSPIHPDR